MMRTLQVLTDVYGPRLTGSPNLKGAVGVGGEGERRRGG